MSPAIGDAVPKIMSFPRVSGDEPYSSTQNEALALFSPRERG